MGTGLIAAIYIGFSSSRMDEKFLIFKSPYKRIDEKCCNLENPLY
jgi:hypothetical protein